MGREGMRDGEGRREGGREEGRKGGEQANQEKKQETKEEKSMNAQEENEEWKTKQEEMIVREGSYLTNQK